MNFWFKISVFGRFNLSNYFIIKMIFKINDHWFTKKGTINILRYLILIILLKLNFSVLFKQGTLYLLNELRFSIILNRKKSEERF